MTCPCVNSAVNGSPVLLVSRHEGGPGATEVGGAYGGGEKGRGREDGKASKQARGGACGGGGEHGRREALLCFGGSHTSLRRSSRARHLCTIQTNLQFFLRAPAPCAKEEVEMTSGSPLANALSFKCRLLYQGFPSCRLFLFDPTALSPYFCNSAYPMRGLHCTLCPSLVILKLMGTYIPRSLRNGAHTLSSRT